NNIWPFDVTPAVDNRPFFFNSSRWQDLFSDVPLVRRSVPVMEITLLTVFFIIAIPTVIFVWWPLAQFKSQAAAIAPWRYGMIFSGTALGYMAIEIALLQKFGLFLGHPNYALSVVLAGLLFATGLGSFASASLCRWFGGPRFVSYLLAFLLLAECCVIIPGLYRWPVSSFGLRVLLVLALTVPLGVLMGTFFPIALERLKADAPDFAPWAWGVNGIFSVLAPILSIGFSMTWGFNALLLSAVPIYIAVSWCFPSPARRPAGQP
ncbi:MAG TPA: hypothetical protein VMI53_11540, partial [Opitutaceae bacterium]|nr:hypothetical protein [Opitutaceae bacterium]